MKYVKSITKSLAVVVAITAAFAFKTPEVKSASSAKRAQSWFIYNGGGLSNPMNYTKVSTAPSCSGDGARCAILADENGSTGRPTQSGVDAPEDEIKFQ